MAFRFFENAVQVVSAGLVVVIQDLNRDVSSQIVIIFETVSMGTGFFNTFAHVEVFVKAVPTIINMAQVFGFTIAIVSEVVSH